MAGDKVNVSITGDAASLIAATKSASSSVKGMVGEFENMGKSATSSLSGIEKASSGLMTGLSKIGLAANGLKAIGDAAVGMGQGLLAGNAQLEMTTVAFTTMLGSGDAANKMLKDLMAFAASTPFELTGLEQTTQKLLAMGFTKEEVIPDLTAIGNAVAGLGGGQAEIDRVTLAFGQMKAKGHAAGGEIMQLTEAGIPAIQMMADAFGVSTEEMTKMVENGAVPADKAIQAMVDGMNKKFPNMMEAQSKTFSGMISNLQDWASQTTITLTKPIFEPAKAGLQKVLDFIGSDAGKQAVSKLADMIQAGVTRIGDMFKELGKGIDLGKLFDDLGKAASTAATGLFSIIDSIIQVIQKSGAIKLAGDIMTKAFQFVGEAVQFVAKLIKDNIGPLSQMVKNFGDTVKIALDLAIGSFKALEGPVRAVVGFLGPMLPLIGYIAGALVAYKVAAEGAAIATGLLSLSQGGLATSVAGGTSKIGLFGKAVLLLGPAFAAWAAANALTNGELDKTKDKLSWLIEHADDVKKVTGKSVAQNVLGDTAGTQVDKAIQPGIDFANNQAADLQKRHAQYLGTVDVLNLVTGAFVKMRTAEDDAAASSEKARVKLQALNEADTSGVLAITKYNKAIEDGEKAERDAIVALGLFGEKYHQLSPVVQAAVDKTGALERQMDATSRAILGVTSANDALQKGFDAANFTIKTMDGAVADLSLKYGNSAIKIDGQTMSVADANTKWKDLVITQNAGGKGSAEAGVAAGKYADAMKDVTKGAITPYIDAQYNALKSTKDAGIQTADNVLKQQALEKQQDATNKKLIEGKSATDELTKITSTHGAVVTDATGKIAGGFWGSQKAIDGANKVMGIWNTTPANPKTPETTFDKIKSAIGLAIEAIDSWNRKNVDNKTATVTYSVGGLIGVGPGGAAPSGGGGTAPTPSPVPSPSRGQSTGLSGALDLGGAASRLSGTFAEATQQAQAATFSLTGLQAQIDQIVKMFNSLDQKALKAAVDQADAVSKIAGAAQAMVGAFTAMKGYTSIGVDVMKQVTADVVTFTQLYIAGASEFKPKALEGAATYIETSGKVADSAGKMVDTLGKLKGYTAVGKDIIWAFSQDVKSLVADFYNASLNFGKDMLPAADAFAATAGNVADATGKGADALKKLIDWAGVADVSIEGFTYNMRIAVANFYNVMKDNLLPPMLEGATQFADTAGKVGEAIGKGADGLSKLLDWQGIATVSIEGFVYNMRIAVANFYNAMKDQFTPEMLEGAGQFAEAGGKVTSIIGGAVEGLKALKDYSAISEASLRLFGNDLVQAVANFANAGTYFNKEGLTAAATFAEAAGKVTGVISGAVAGLAALADYKSIVQASLDRFMTDVMAAVRAFGAASESFKPEAVAATAVFAEGVGKMTDGLGHAVTLFEGLSKYKGIPQKTLQAFLDDVRETVRLAGQMAVEVGTTLMAQIDAFGTAVGKLFTGLSSAMTLFQGLEKYQSVPSKVIQAFINEIELTINLAYQLAQKTDVDLLAKATDFATAVGKIFTQINTAITTFKGLQDLKDDPKNTITMLINAVDEAIKKMPQANSQAQSFYNNIDQWATKMEQAAKRAQDGLEAMNRALNIAGTTPGGSTPAPWTGPGNDPNGPGGLALGGLVQKSGVYTVGEFGPEQVWLPGGASVASNGRSVGGPSVHLQGNVYITIAPPAGTDAATIARLVQDALRQAPNQARANQIAGYSSARGI